MARIKGRTTPPALRDHPLATKAPGLIFCVGEGHRIGLDAGSQPPRVKTTSPPPRVLEAGHDAPDVSA